MNNQDLYVPDTAGDNVNPAPAEVQKQDDAPAEVLERKLEIPQITADESMPNIEADTPELPPPEASPGVEETARRVFSGDTTKPLAINLQLVSTAKQGHFLPQARVEIDPNLRTSGLLAAMPAEEVKTLIALLTFLTPNGDVKPTAWEVSQGLSISEAKAKERLSRLLRFRWQARPLVATLWRETGMDGYTLTHDAVAYRQAETPRSTNPQPAYRTAGRDAVIAHSRARYARPRIEVERQIAMAQGWPLPEDQNAGGAEGTTQDTGMSSVDYLRQRLFRLGVTSEQAELLLETFPSEEIEQQIAWLLYRGAKNPASYLVAAITGGYAEPGLLQMRREQQQLAPPTDRGDVPPWNETTP